MARKTYKEAEAEADRIIAGMTEEQQEIWKRIVDTGMHFNAAAKRGMLAIMLATGERPEMDSVMCTIFSMGLWSGLLLQEQQPEYAKLMLGVYAFRESPDEESKGTPAQMQKIIDDLMGIETTKQEERSAFGPN